MRRSRAVPPTERAHPASEALESLSIKEIVRALHREDRRAFDAVGKARAQIARLATAAHQALSRGGRLVYVGAGTSGRLGALDAAELPPTFGTAPRRVIALIAGGPRALRRAVEGAEDDPKAARADLRKARVGPKDLVCGISASGRTPYVLEALLEARRRGATTALVTCGPVPGLPPHVLVRLETGPELIAGSTRLKAGTATKIVLNAVSTAAMVRLGRVLNGRMVDAPPTNAKLRARAERIVAELAGVDLPIARKALASTGYDTRKAIPFSLSLSKAPRT